jgi:hypothetical protein
VLDRSADHEGVGEIVDVLAGAEQVNEFFDVGERGAFDALLEVVLDGYDVVHR